MSSPFSTYGIDGRLSRRIVKTIVLLLGLGLALAVGFRLRPSDTALEAARSAPEKTDFSLIPTSEKPLGLYGVGNRIEGMTDGGSVTLAQDLDPFFSGSLSPLAVPSPDGSFILYNAWRTIKEMKPVLSMSQQGIQSGDAVGLPLVRFYDKETKADTLLIEGAYSPAISATGQLAYLKGSAPEYRANVKYQGHVEVRPSPTGPAEQWTQETAHYVVLAWSKNGVLVGRQKEGGSWDLLVLDGPGQVRTLAQDSSIIALSPDGGKVLTTRLGGVDVADLIDVQSGKILSSLDLPGQRWSILSGGDWVGNKVVTGGDGGMLIFQIDGDKVELAQRVRIPRQGQALMTMSQHHFVDDKLQSVAAWGTHSSLASSQSHSSVFVRCFLSERKCHVSPPLLDGLARSVGNPSRPE